MCLLKDYSQSVLSVPMGHDREKEIKDTFLVLSEKLLKTGNIGASHLYSVFFYILLSEQGVDSEIHIGYAKGLGENKDVVFGHSWNEINGGVFDVAIQLSGTGARPPIFNGIDVGTGCPSLTSYGVGEVNVSEQRVVEEVANECLGKYLKGVKNDALWQEMVNVGRSLGLNLKFGSLKEKYSFKKRLRRGF